MDQEKKFNNHNSSYKKPISCLYAYSNAVINILANKKPKRTDKTKIFITKYLRPHPKKRWKENH